MHILHGLKHSVNTFIFKNPFKCSWKTNVTEKLCMNFKICAEIIFYCFVLYLKAERIKNRKAETYIHFPNALLSQD